MVTKAQSAATPASLTAPAQEVKPLASNKEILRMIPATESSLQEKQRCCCENCQISSQSQQQFSVNDSSAGFEKETKNVSTDYIYIFFCSCLPIIYNSLPYQSIPPLQLKRKWSEDAQEEYPMSPKDLPTISTCSILQWKWWFDHRACFPNQTRW